jgi:GNAT superfamily N-acetyltransferase
VLTTTELKPEWWPLFDPRTPNDVILRSALAGRSPGLAYLDRCESPEQIVVRTCGGKAFASTSVSESFLHEAIGHARRLGWTSLADTGIPDGVRERGRVVERTRFDDCDLGSETLRSLRGQLPPELEVRSLDRDLLQRCPHAKRELPKDYGDDLDSYFDFGYGICLLREGDVICEAYTGYVAEGRAEVIVGTVESFRGRGLASVASAFLAEEARRRGHEFTWSCMTENVGSMRVARRLPFRSEGPYSEIYY